MQNINIRTALNQAMTEEMQKDENVFLIGEEVAEYDGAYKVSKGLLNKFGEKRVLDTPISEAGFVGLGIGAAMTGLRPIVEVMTWNFGIQAFDQIITHGSKMLYMSGGQFNIPMVIRGPNGAAHMLAAQHSQSVDSILTTVPGLKVISVATPYDAKGLLKSAIRDNNPVIFLESEMLYNLKGQVPDETYTINIGEADIKKHGQDVTVVAWNKMLHKTLEVGNILSKDFNIEIEIIDPRTLVPLDKNTILESVKKTNRLVIVDESPPLASFSSEIAYIVQNEMFDYLDAPIERVNSDHVPIPYAENLEKQVLPSKEKIIAAVKRVMYIS